MKERWQNFEYFRSPEHIPIGESQKLEKEKETLPVAEIKNRVKWVNPSFAETVPFKLKEGESTDLGVFFTPEKSGDRSVEVQAGHHRSGLLGRVVFKDSEERLYRDIDIKGLGHVGWGLEDVAGKSRLKWREGLEDRSSTMTVQPVTPKESGWKGAYGTIDIVPAEKNRDMEEKFLELGIRTTRTLAIVELKEIIGEGGEKISIEEARKRGMIPEAHEPVLVVRGFGTKARLNDVIEDAPNAQVLFDDARKIVAAEQGEENIGRTRYFTWLAETVGKSVARMHNGGYVHRNLHAQNITLDGRIMDLDSVKKVSTITNEKASEEIKEDLELAEGSLMELVVAAGKIPGLKHIVGPLGLWAIFKKAYYSEMKRLQKPE